MAWQGMACSFIELCRSLLLNKAVIHERALHYIILIEIALSLWNFSFPNPSMRF